MMSHAELVMLEVRAELLELAMIARLLDGEQRFESPSAAGGND